MPRKRKRKAHSSYKTAAPSPAYHLVHIAIDKQHHARRTTRASLSSKLVIQAIQSLREAVDYGSSIAAHNIALIYEHGLGHFERDANKALEWHQTTYRLNGPGARFSALRLSDIYFKGLLGQAIHIELGNAWATRAHWLNHQTLPDDISQAFQDLFFNPHFVNHQSCLAHFRKHRNEFNFQTPEQYESAAQAVIATGQKIVDPDKNHVNYIRPRNDNLFELVGVSPKGAIKTFHTRKRIRLEKAMGKGMI